MVKVKSMFDNRKYTMKYNFNEIFIHFETVYSSSTINFTSSIFIKIHIFQNENDQIFI